MAQTITTAELAQKVDKPGVAIVDVRPIAAYNGWRLQNEARGGHIKGAVTFPLEWTSLMERGDQRDVLQEKKVSPEKTIVVYGYGREDAANAASWLEALGYPDVHVYEEGLPAWALDDSLPMARLPNYEKLVPPQWVRQLIEGEIPDTCDGNGYAIFHINCGGPDEYAAGHIPGAFYLDTNTLESPVDWNRRSPEEIKKALQENGISYDRTVVLYGRDSSPTMADRQPGQKAGQIAATRAAAVLMYAGVEDVRLLDGGFDRWLDAGYEVDTELNAPTPVDDFGVAVPDRRDYFVDLDEAKRLIADPDGVLVSIRCWREFVGDTSGYHYIEPRGRIAGAVWGNCGTDAYHMQHYRNVDNTMREYHEIVANWRQEGITADKRVAFYCGTGWRASETFFYAYLLGWPNVAVYDGGWYEWSRDPANPIESGIPAPAKKEMGLADPVN